MFKEEISQDKNKEGERQFQKIEKEYENLFISYEVEMESFYSYGIISDELDVAKVFRIKNLQIKDKNSGKIFSPSLLLPEGYQLAMVENDKSRVISHKKLVNISGLGDFGNQFTLLHEIAHARESRNLDAYKTINVGGEELEILTTISTEEFQEEITHEKDADKFALSKLLELRNEGINLEPEMDDKKLAEHIQKRKKYLSHLSETEID